MYKPIKLQVEISKSKCEVFVPQWGTTGNSGCKIKIQTWHFEQ